MSADERISQLEQSYKILLELARNASERDDTHLTWINNLGEAQANTEVKMAALVDAQIRTEETLNKLSEAQALSDTKMAQLAEAQIRTEETLNRLSESQATSAARITQLAEAQTRTEETLNRLSEAQATSDARMATLAEAMAKLAESQMQSDRQLKALTDIASRGNDGQTQE